FCPAPFVKLNPRASTAEAGCRFYIGSRIQVLVEMVNYFSAGPWAILSTICMSRGPFRFDAARLPSRDGERLDADAEVGWVLPPTLKEESAVSLMINGDARFSDEQAALY
ncbi:MAG: hypothetical protein M3362_03940, partial [Acidobacteriota bacterium]|nr:hypothetical protein [Acidobacteriota bacterium]